MEREVMAMATQLESSVGFKRKERIMDDMVEERIRYFMLEEFADDFRDVDIKGGMKWGDIGGMGDGKESGGGDIIELAKTKGEDGDGGIKDGSGCIIELAKTKGGEAESGSKGEGCSAVKKRTKKVKCRVKNSIKPLFEKYEKEPIHFDLSLLGEAFAASLSKYLEFQKDILEQFKTKGYAEYEREVEVTDDEEDDPLSVLS